MTYKSGMVGLIGRPNVGKSTLINTLVGEKVAIVSPKPQTTRNRILGVRHMEGGQMVLLDTPGFHKAKGGLNQFMVETAMAAARDADVVWLMLEVSPKFIAKPGIGEGNRILLEVLKDIGRPVILVLNKIDSLEKKEALLPFISGLTSGSADGFKFEGIVPISALTGDGCDHLAETTMNLLPEGPAWFDGDSYTDRTLRFLSEELIREKLFDALGEELPYGCAVQVESFVEPDERNPAFRIHASIHVEHDSQKGIVIGKGGSMLKHIGTQARLDITKLLDAKVRLDLNVKVSKNWSSDPRLLERLGYK